MMGFGSMGSVSSPLRFSQTRGRMQNGNGAGVNYPSPFFDVAHTYLPTTVKQMFRWCRYYFLTNPLINATVFKLSEYPVTDILFDHTNTDVIEKWTEYFQDHLRYRAFQIEVGLDYHCFDGATRVVLRDGVHPIRDLVGKTVDVLSAGGVYRPAEFRSYGKQELWEVHTDDGVILATEGHRWPVRDAQGDLRWTTTRFLKNQSIPRSPAQKPAQDDAFWEGVRHGVVFGDGTLSNEGKQAHVLLHTKEKRALARYFEGHATVTPHHEEKYLGVYGLPPSFKRLPEKTASASYWYGFVCGLLATDGSVDNRGQAVLTQKDRSVLLAVSEQLPRLGLVGGRVREHWAWNSFTKQREPMNYLSLKTQFLSDQDFVREDQRARFVEHQKGSKYGRFLRVKQVRATGRVEEVFCCEEPETRSFVIENAVLTGNCYGNAFVSIGYPFKKYLKCMGCGAADAATRLRASWVFANYNFRLSCPKCGHMGDAAVEDVYFRNPSGIKMIRWNPEDIEISYNDLTGEYTYFYTIPATVRNDIVIGKKDVLESIPQVFIAALQQQKGVVFSKDNLFHLRRPTLATHDRGWGIPLLLPVLKDVFYLQIMKKAQEAILLEHIVPLRILFPQAGSGTSDPYTSVNLVDWREHVATEIARWRYDHNYIPVLPLPVGNQTIGGDGRALLMTSEIQQWSEQIMVGMGVPREFLIGGMSYAGTNVSMRMLENAFIGYILRHKALARWVMREVSHFLRWPSATVRFKPFKMADDLQRKAFDFQLNQAGKLSDTTLLSGSDYSQDEENQIMEKETAARLKATKAQQLAMAEIQGEQQLVMSKYQVKAQQAAQQDMAAPNAPGEPGGPEAMGQGTPGGQEVAGAETQQQPQSALQAMQSPLSQGQQMQNGQPGAVDLPTMAYMNAQSIAAMPPPQQQQAVDNLAMQSPELADLVVQMLRQMGVQVQRSAPQGPAGQAPGPQVDMRPLPEQRAPRRENPLV